MSVLADIKHLERQINLKLRSVQLEDLTREERQYVSQIKLALNESRLDVRDYEYAQTRQEQVKWAKLGRHNLLALNALLLKLDTVFGAADIAASSAYIDKIADSLE